MDAAPGDVLAVWTGDGFVDRVIRLGSLLQGKPAIANHVIIVTHQDTLGRWMGIEGRPGGVGPVDCTPYLADARTRSNHTQPRSGTAGQVDSFLASCALSLGLAYDWVGIAEDALDALHLEDMSEDIDPIWRSNPGLLPGHVVCSSLAAFLYDLPAIGWDHPGLLKKDRTCTPADWWYWSDLESWW